MNSRLLARIAFATLGAGVLASPAVARAQSPDELRIVRQIAAEGLEAYEAKNYEEARQLFSDAKAIYPSAPNLRMLGRALIGLERWEEAVEALEGALSTDVAPLGAGDRKEAEQELKSALSHFGTVSVTSKVRGAELVVDGGAPRKLPLERPLRLLEGKHRLTVRAPAHEDVSSEVEVEGGEALSVELDPGRDAPAAGAPEPRTPRPAAPPPAPPPKKGWFPGQRTAGFVTIGVGAAAGGAALVTALAGAHVRRNVEQDVAIHRENFGENCERADFRLCAYDREVINRDADRADALRDASVWMGIGAGALVVGGIALLVFAGPASPDARPGAERASRASSRVSQPRRRPKAGSDGSVACGPLLGGPAAGGLTCAGRF